MTKRWRRLVIELEGGFARMTCLLNDTDWLVRNGVTLTECHRLSDEIRSALRLKRALATTHGKLSVRGDRC